MAKLDFIKKSLQDILLNMTFGTISTTKGALRYEGDELVAGIQVMIIDEEGNESVPEDGDYYLGDEDGRTLVVKDGKIEEIKERPEEPAEEAVEADGEEPADEPSNEPSGDEPSGDEPSGDDSGEEGGDSSDEGEEGEEGEEEDAPKKKKKNAFTKIKEAYSESYAEKERQISEAIHLMGFDGWIVDAGDDFAVMEVWIEETMDYKYYRFAISWDGEGNPVIGEYEEVKNAFVPVEEPIPEIDTEVFKKQIAELEKRIAELEKQPAGEPAKQTYKKTNFKTTGDERLDNLMKYCK